MSPNLLGGLGVLAVAVLLVGAVAGLPAVASTPGAVPALAVALAVVLVVVAAGLAGRPVVGNPYW